MKSFLYRFCKTLSGLCAITLVLALGMSAGNGEIFGVRFAAAQSEPETIAVRAVNQRIREAMAVQDRHTEQLIRIPGVVGIGTGIGANGRPVIRVFSRVPGISGIPQTLDGVPVTVKVTGMFIAYIDPRDRIDRPVPIGVSTGHPDITAGTIGARVKDEGGNVYALSNNHVYANQNDADIGDSILQPGTFDGGSDPADKIGELFDFEVIDFSIFGSNTMDAAIAGTTPSELGQATLPQGYGMPNSIIFGDMDRDGFFDNKNDLLQLPVQKFGRTTGLTHGQISEINVTSAVCYANCSDLFESKLAWFEDQISIISNTTAAFSGGGDSGSLVLTDDPDKHPVALLFAGSENSTLANRIDLVLDRFDVSIDGAAPEDICQSDFDLDADVDGYDLLLLLEFYPSGSSADLNDDGFVNSDDLSVFSDEFGRNDCP